MKKLYRPYLSYIWFFLFSVFLIYTQGCREDQFINDSDAALEFSLDTLQFDTVFTTVGSATRSFKVFNPHNRSIEISSVSLAGGDTSQFRMNIDGIPGNLQENLIIAPEDSMYVFVEVTVNPVSPNSPLVITDSIVFVTNGNIQDVQLVAWGQNARFYSGVRICDEVWDDELPYVIYNSVQIDSNCTLTITEGVRVYFHSNSVMLVDGTLLVNGTKDSIVTFQADRLEPFFDDKPGQWPGIYFLRGSTGNQINYAEIKNSDDGIVSGFSKSPEISDFNSSNKPEIELNNVSIHDCLGSGIFSIASDITATNCLVYNIGNFNAALLLGGSHQFTHCTLANFGSFYVSHQTPILGLSTIFDFGQDETGNDIILESELQANFVNCIVEGSILEGAEVALGDTASPLFNYQFTNCLIRTDLEPNQINAENCIFNTSPLFTDISERDYHLLEGSPAINTGLETGIMIDLEGNLRPFMGGIPDVGAFESEF